MNLGQCAACAHKAAFVCMQLRWLLRVDELLIRALTAGVKRSMGDAGA